MDHATIAVLLIEDDAVDATQVYRSLQQPLDSAFAARLEHVTTLQEGIDRLGKGDIEVVLLDLHLPDSEGPETVARLREHDADIPIVVLTVSRDSQTSLRSLQKGAQDYLAKDEISVPSALFRSIRHAIERRSMERRYRSLAERLSRTEKTASLGVLAAGLAMSFNEMLGQILEEVDVSIQSLDEPEDEPRWMDRQRSRLQSIRRTTLRAGDMVSRLRDYAADQPCAIRAIALPGAVLDSSECLETLVGERAEIVYDLAAETPSVRSGRLQLHQILLSLVTNAAESIRVGRGRISISTGSVEADRGLLARSYGHPAPQPGRYAFLRVSDTGCGIPERDQGRIFDPFFTTKRAGRGLGLAAVLGILRELRAVIVVESRPRRGACFTVLFPA